MALHSQLPIEHFTAHEMPSFHPCAQDAQWVAAARAGNDAERFGEWDALLLGVYLHGAAADTLVRQGVGPIGLTASEVTDAARGLLNQWVYCCE